MNFRDWLNSKEPDAVAVQPVLAAAEQYASPQVDGEPVSLQITADTALAADIRVFMVKEQIDPDAARAAHERVIRFLQSLAPQIDHAAGYARQIKQGLQRAVEQQNSAGGA
ncbi:MAG TPA: hypothetical protein VD932_03870 [Aquabacterium sp.]|nr:hypothetical protein [Aquabacterium sp.]